MTNTSPPCFCLVCFLKKKDAKVKLSHCRFFQYVNLSLVQRILSIHEGPLIRPAHDDAVVSQVPCMEPQALIRLVSLMC